VWRRKSAKAGIEDIFLSQESREGVFWVERGAWADPTANPPNI